MLERYQKKQGNQATPAKSALLDYTIHLKDIQTHVSHAQQHHLVVNLNVMVVAQVNTKMTLLETQMVMMTVMYVH